MRRKTQEEFINEVEKEQGHRIEVIGQYKNVDTKVEVKCRVCGLHWQANPYWLTHKKVGLDCEHPVKLSFKDVQAKIDKATNGSVTMIGGYKSTGKKAKMRCNNCGYEWHTQPNLVYRGLSKCPKEAGVLAHDTKWFKEQVGKTAPHKYVVVGQYVNWKSKIKIFCKKCKENFWMVAGDFVRRGCKCPLEATDRRKQKLQVPLNTVKRRLATKTHGEIQIWDDSEYHGVKFRITMWHKKCGYLWQGIPDEILRGARWCPRCAESKGERLTRYYLMNRKVKFKAQYKFDDCRDQLPLPFDFAVFDSNNKLTALIEYQGIQHYYWMKNYHKATERSMFTNDQVQLIHKHDLIKKNFCKKHSIQLIEIKHKSLNDRTSGVKNLVKKTLDHYLHVNPVPSTSES